MAAFLSGPKGQSASNGNVAASRSIPGGGQSWRRSTSSSPLPSPPSTPPNSTPSWRRRSSSSFSNDSQTSWASSSNWRASSPPQSSKVTSLPAYEEAQPGDVLLLPPEQPPSDSIIYKKLGTSTEKPWGHPAVITGKFEEDGKQCVRIRLCTTFGGRRIEAHRKPEHWNLFVLADNEVDAKPHNSTCLAMLAPGSGKFLKRTYVNLGYNSEYPIEFKYLERWGWTPVKFDAKSTQRIIDRNSS
ncbi:Nn.00g064740.m01.CDS01 [Neocucurbitaria sp. VM-36]